MKSSQKGERKILGKVTVREAESALEDLANLQAEFDYRTGRPKGRDQIARLLRRHPHLWGGLGKRRPRSGSDERSVRVRELLQSIRKLQRPFKVEWNILQVRDLLRKAWDATDPRSREWYVFGARVRHLVAYTGRPVTINSSPPSPKLDEEDQHFDRRLEFFWDVPPTTEFEVILYYFQAYIRDRARHCQNGADCPAPYFIAAKRWQKYCSDACAVPAQRAAKRKWWNEHRKNGGVQ
jgi:hypothetical protein